MMNGRYKLSLSDYVIIGIVIIVIIAGVIHIVEAAINFISNLF